MATLAPWLCAYGTVTVMNGVEVSLRVQVRVEYLVCSCREVAHPLLSNILRSSRVLAVRTRVRVIASVWVGYVLVRWSKHIGLALQASHYFTDS